MNTPATPTTDDPDSLIETYSQTSGDGHRELVFDIPGKTHGWITATPSSTVELEDYR